VDRNRARWGTRQSRIQRRARRTGITALALLATTMAGALVLARGYRLGIAATLVALLGGIPGLYLMWAAYRDDRAEAVDAESLDLEKVADELARSVRAEWEAEASARRLNDPLLPVCWVAADSRLAEGWQSLVALATGGAGWPVPLSVRGWASKPSQLAGEGGDIADALALIPTRRLVVLGEPGAGKTMLLVRLVLDLLARREPGEPVPMLVSLGSWNPISKDLREWLAEQITVDYPALRAPAGGGSFPGNRAQALLTRGLILPMLDGLDELPETLWSTAIARINEALRPGEAVVMSSRNAAYKAAVRPPHGKMVTLRGGAVIEMRPVDGNTARKYLLHDVEDTRRWNKVIASLGTPTPVGQALSTPLMLSLAREIYSPPPSADQRPTRDPSELFSSSVSSREMVEQYLLDAYIPAAYRHLTSGSGKRRGSWPASDAERWLMFLARHLEHRVTSPNFAWWQLEQAIPRITSSIAAVTAAALGFGLTLAITAGVPADLPTKVVTGLAVALIAGLAVWRVGRTRQHPMTGVGWSLLSAVRRMRWPNTYRSDRPSGELVMLGGLALPIGAILTGLGFGPAGALGWLLVSLAVLGVHGVYSNLARASSPQLSLARDRRNLPLLGLTVAAYSIASGLVLGTVCGRGAKMLFGDGRLPSVGTAAGLGLGIACALGFSVVAVAWSRWQITCASLAASRRLPWRMMRFLEDAHRRGVLRQAGAMYQFRHLELQRRLADRIQ
jgi:hypothetical protein